MAFATLSSEAKALVMLGGFLLFCDFGWWLSWISFCGNDLTHNNVFRGSCGFNALASPHTALIPAMISILNDIFNNCSTTECKLSTPNYQWFIITIIVVPYDALLLKLNSLQYGLLNDYSTVLPIYALVNDACVFGWAVASFFTIRSHLAAKTRSS